MELAALSHDIPHKDLFASSVSFLNDGGGHDSSVLRKALVVAGNSSTDEFVLIGTHKSSYLDTSMRPPWHDPVLAGSRSTTALSQRPRVAPQHMPCVSRQVRFTLLVSCALGRLGGPITPYASPILPTRHPPLRIADPTLQQHQMLRGCTVWGARLYVDSLAETTLPHSSNVCYSSPSRLARCLHR